MKMNSWWDNFFVIVLEFCCKDTGAYDTKDGPLRVCVPCTPNARKFNSELKGKGLASEEPAVFDSIPEESEHGTLHRMYSDDT